MLLQGPFRDALLPRARRAAAAVPVGADESGSGDEDALLRRTSTSAGSVLAYEVFLRIKVDRIYVKMHVHPLYKGLVACTSYYVSRAPGKVLNSAALHGAPITP